MAERNWAGNISYGTENIHRPETREQVRALVAQCSRIKALGTRHSFNAIADSTENLVSLEKMNRVLEIDAARRTVTVEAGITYGALGRRLHAEGWALSNMASLPHISVGGACATATHGSGSRKACLSGAVSAMQVVTASGEIVELSRERDNAAFQRVVVHLGAIGVVMQLTLDIVPDYAMRQDVYENLSFAQAEAHFEAIMASADSVSLFTDWKGPRFTQVWRKRQVPPDDALPAEPEFFGATLAARPLHPLPGVSAEHCTAQRGSVGPWHERLPHFRLDFTPSGGEELQSEYLLPRRFAVPALRALAELREQIAPLILISEVRAVAADTLWMSPCYQQDSVAFHFTWRPDRAAVSELLPQIESALVPFYPRPHWGKLFTMDAAQIAALYPKLPEFRQTLQYHDPQGKFRNAFLEKHLFASV